ncbi:Pre-mRNA-splicing factor of RES complex-domain-containing protein [Chytriomyces sp. MP71]|nr:Pre-mRNA-splicing factor of RES complex-domain-containing protein [Chytriomyces sp. MP71]
MSSKREILARYLSAEAASHLTASSTAGPSHASKKKTKKAKAARHSATRTTTIVDEDDNGFNQSGKEADDDGFDEEDAVVVADLRGRFSADSFSVIRESATSNTVEEDALEAIAGGDSRMTVKEMHSQLQQHGFAVSLDTGVHPDDVVREGRSPNQHDHHDDSGKRRTPSPSDFSSDEGEPKLPQMQQTVYRDKQGRLINKDAEAELNRVKALRDEEERVDRLKFKQGLAQERAQAAFSARLEREKKEKFAVHKDDEELNERLKGRTHWGDPLAGLGSSSSSGLGSKGGRADRMRYAGSFMPNRFGIEPGYRWDGVDRGNGFESKLTQSKYAKVSLAQEAYKWSTEDM